MDIRFSRYNLPFIEASQPGVHYIPLDAQRDMRLGLFDGHVRLYSSLPKSDLFEVFDPLTGSTHCFDLSLQDNYLPFSRTPPPLSADEMDFLNDLFFESGIKAAGHMSGRTSRQDVFAHLSVKVDLNFSSQRTKR